MVELVEPATRMYAAFRQARADWGPGVHEDGFGIHAADDVDSPGGFVAWVERLREQTEPTSSSAAARPRPSYWWIVDAGTLLGAIVLRRGPSDVVARIGHVGYGVRPSARGRGFATWALGQVLSTARADGLDRLLVVCQDENAASALTIERNGGHLEAIVDSDDGRYRRYGIALADGA